jgi:predicted Zn-dependent peptidase
VALGYPGRFETVEDYANQVASLVRLDLPFNTFNEYTKRILEVTVDDALRCAKTYIDVANMAIIVVGDREKVESGIRELGLGPLTVWSIEEVLGPPPSMQ